MKKKLSSHIACEECGAKPGEPCQTGGKPHPGMIHAPRMRDALLDHLQQNIPVASKEHEE